MRQLGARDLMSTGMRHTWRRRTDEARPLRKSANVLAHLRFLYDLVAVGFGWTPAQPGDGPYQRRRYREYREYLQHQARKLPRLKLDEYDRTYRQALRERLAALPLVLERARVLCLAARLGTEVKAFLDLGAFAIGLDINPGPGNKYVVHGDFHHLQYADGSVDLVFSNSLDHVFDVDQWLQEIRRVLARHGLLLLDVGQGLGEGGRPEFYESLCWASIPELVADLERRGLQVVHQRPFDVPVRGQQLLLRWKSSADGAPVPQGT